MEKNERKFSLLLQNLSFEEKAWVYAQAIKRSKTQQEIVRELIQEKIKESDEE